jgi:hypothetical protein
MYDRSDVVPRRGVQTLPVVLVDDITVPDHEHAADLG